MKDLNLFYTDIEQVVGINLIKNLESINDTDFYKSFPNDWGPDRIVSLKKNDTPVKRQWNGTCTSFATIAAIENKLKGEIELSERSLWDFYGKYSTKMAIRTAQNSYVLEEVYWPQGQSNVNDDLKKKGRFRIDEVSYLERKYLSVLKAIDNGNPCVVALKTPKDLAKGYKQVEATSKISRKGGHAMCVVGYKVENSKCYFEVKNSWGDRNGDAGYQYISFDLYKTTKNRYCIFWEILKIEERQIPSSMQFALDEDNFGAIWDFK